MKAVKFAVIVSITTALITPVRSFAVPDTKLAVYCPDVVLTWPSTNGQSFLIQTRPDLNPDTPWAWLTNFYPAAAGTNRTYFVHPNQMNCPSGQTFGAKNMPGSESRNAQEDFLTSEKSFHLWGLGPWVMPRDESRMPVPLNIYPPGIDLTGQIIIWPDGSTSEWTQEAAATYAQIKQTERQNGPQPQDAGNGGVAGMAFYRVIDVTPKIRTDIFGVEQDSYNNQLDLLANDSDPNDDRILISNVTLAQHGDIAYTLDGSIFQYTPDSGFYGTDSFTYSATNQHGSWATATVTVFVNQSGNSRPVAGQTIITLETNTYAVALNVLTNCYDPDDDAMNLFSLGTARLGTLSNNGNGNVLYQRNPDWFGRDEFSYVVTDGHGGYDSGSVVILQVDSDEDNMPDEWEMRHGLDPFADDSAADPDGDGLPNLGEYKLHTNPRVADNPLTISVADNTELSGFVQLPLTKLSPVIQNPSIGLFVNNLPGAESFLSQGPDGTWLLNWNTFFLANGVYSLKARFQYRPDATFGNESSVLGPTTTVVVTNLVRFDQLTSRFSDFLVIDATVATPNATYRVDLYDVDGSPLVYTTGAISNGQIQLYWDLTDGAGNQLSSNSINSRFTITPQGQSPVVLWKDFPKERVQVPGNTFVLAWGWDYYGTTFLNHRNQMMQDSVINILGNPSDFNSYYLLPTLNWPYGGASFRYDDETDKQALLSALEQSSYFFWLGHGGFDTIHGNEKKSSLAPADVQKTLQNYSILSRPNHPKEDKHPFKLVVLDGCEAYSPLWAGAFGIPFSSETSTNIVLEYQYSGRTPRAFVAFTNTVLIPNAVDVFGQTHTEFGLALGRLWSDWMAYYPLEFCIDDFEITAMNYGFDGHDSWKISGCIDLRRGD